MAARVVSRALRRQRHLRSPLASALTLPSAVSPSLVRGKQFATKTLAEQGYTGGLQTGVAEEVHGGDDIHRVGKLIADFSVTTNALGPVPAAVHATRELFDDAEDTWTTRRGGDIKALLDEQEEHVFSAPSVEHYPQRKDPELSALAAGLLCQRGAESQQEVEERLAFGNGASELIDLVCRTGPAGQYSLTPGAKVQYREYERACKNAGRTLAKKAARRRSDCNR